MNEKSLPLDPNQLFLFSKEEMSSMKISRLEEEVCKSEEARTIQSPTDEDRQSACYSGKKTHSIKNNLLCIGNLRIVWLSSTYEGH